MNSWLKLIESRDCLRSYKTKGDGSFSRKRKFKAGGDLSFFESLQNTILKILVKDDTDFPLKTSFFIDSLKKHESISATSINIVLEKLSVQEVIRGRFETEESFSVDSVDVELTKTLLGEESKTECQPSLARTISSGSSSHHHRRRRGDFLEKLLSHPTVVEKSSRDFRIRQDLDPLLNKPTALQRIAKESFQKHIGPNFPLVCRHGTKQDCSRNFRPSDTPDDDDLPYNSVSASSSSVPCNKLHFKRVETSASDPALGDCSFLNTCFNPNACKFVHYCVERPLGEEEPPDLDPIPSDCLLSRFKTGHIVRDLPAQWMNCDLRSIPFNSLGKFDVIMADPPWDIHMELPYGTLSDEEMCKLDIPTLQDDGFLFLWVTGRSMEVGRRCLKLWGYERVEEIVWVKTNQLHRLIRTGRTGHWLNHGKEHCLVGKKGSPQWNTTPLDCDVIVSQVRQTSRKPDEIYSIIERLRPGPRKLELFGRQHNTAPNWLTLGNQLSGARLVEPNLVKVWQDLQKKPT